MTSDTPDDLHARRPHLGSPWAAVKLLSTPDSHIRRLLLAAPYGKPGTFAGHLAEALRSAGCIVHAWDYRIHARPLGSRIHRTIGSEKRAEKRAGDGLAKAARRIAPDAIVIVKGELIPPGAIEECANARDPRRGPMPIIACHNDDPLGYKGNENSRLALSLVDAAATYDSGHVEPIAHLNPHTYHVPVACNPKMHRPVRREKEYDVGFIGNPREPGSPLHDLLDAVLADDLTLGLWGEAWKNADHVPARVRAAAQCRGAHGPRLSEDLSRCRVAINETDRQSVHGTNQRVFEAVATGLPVVTDDLADTRRQFAPHEIAFYPRGDHDSAIRAARQILAHDDERAPSSLARARALADHTYEHRARDILSIIDDMIGMKTT